MAATILASNSKTILDLTDGGVLTTYLTCNQPKVQVYDTNSGVYSPNWTSSNVVITPSVFLDQTALALTNSKLTLTWKRREGNGTEANLTTGESVASGVLTVNQNKLSSITSGILTYVLTVRYQDVSTRLDLTVKTDITFTLTKTGSNSKLVSITGDQVFKIDTNGTVSPSSITLTAYAQNVTISKWQYKNASGNWVDYGSITGATLTILPGDSVWTNNVANIKVVSSDTNVYDTISLYKVADGSTISMVQYQEGTSATTAPTGSWSDNPVTVAEGNYLWTKTTYTDNTISYSIAKQGVTGESGDDASVVFLTNENITFSGDKDGKVAAVTKVCKVVAYTGTTKVTPTVGTPSGAVTGMTVTKGSASSKEIPISIAITADATLGGAGEQTGTISVPITKPVSTTLQIQWSKVNTGATGVSGLNVATVYLYKRSASTPAAPTSSLTYTFSTGDLSGTLDGWTQTVPSGVDPCYVTLATASANTATDTIASNEWSSPVMFVQNGANGSNGANGYNQATIYLYQRAASAPSKPTANVVYTFSTGALDSTPTGWSRTVPAANGNPCFVTTAAAISQSSTVTIKKAAWSDVVKLVEDGSDGTNGLNVATVYLYIRSSTEPSAPSSALTYTFATGVLSGTLDGWSQAMPSGTDPCYIILATASANTATDTIASSEWSSPVLFVKNGANGSQGAAGINGYNQATIYLYQRAASAPSKPSSNVTYTFSTGALDSTPSGWSRTVPAVNGNPCFVTTAAAISQSSSVTIAKASWSDVVKLVEDGADGGPGAPGANGLNVATVYLYKRATTTPTKPSANLTYTFSTGILSGTLSGWTQTVPSGLSPCYIILATASANTATDTITSGEWSSPVMLVQNGTNGSNGTNGENGYNQATIYLYQRAASAPSKPSTSVTYTFSTGELSSTPTGWSRSVPAVNGNPCFVTTASAISQTSTATIASSSWSDVVKLVEDGEDGTSAYILSVYAPTGTVFNNGVINGSTSLTLNVQFYQGYTDLTSDSNSYFLWEKYVDGDWVVAQAEAAGSSGNSLPVNASDVAVSMNYRCRARHGSSSTTYFYDTITVVNKVDNYQAGIESTSGDIFQNGVGESTLYCRVWQAGIEVDPLKKAGNAYVFSEDAPENPEADYYYYQIQSNSPSTQLKRYNGTSWVNASHLYTYTWYRRDINGNPLDSGNAFATGKVIHITGDDVEGKTTFVCEVGTIAIAQFSIRDDSDIVIQDSPPTDPALNLLWLDVGVTPNVLKKYNGTNWQIVNDTGNIYNTITESINEATENILSTVNTRISEAQLTPSQFVVLFKDTVKNSIFGDTEMSISDVNNALNDYKTNVSVYMRYDDTGTLTLGNNNDSFKTQITNQRMSFLEGDTEVAYISNNSMFITNARVTDTLSIGTAQDGYFDWTVTATGLGLKWRNA